MVDEMFYMMKAYYGPSCPGKNDKQTGNQTTSG